MSRDPIFSWYVTRCGVVISRHRPYLGGAYAFLRAVLTFPEWEALDFEHRKTFEARRIDAWTKPRMRGPRRSA